MIYAEYLLIGIAAPLCVCLLFMRGAVRRFLLLFVGGMGLCLLSAYTGGFLQRVTGFSLDDMAVYVSPISEECMKTLPLLFFFLVFEPEEDSLIHGAIAVGSGFATFENCCYLLAGGADNIRYVLVRGLSVGVMHTFCAVVCGVSFAVLRKDREIALVGTLGTFALIVTFHAMYNLLVSVPGISRAVGYILPMAAAGSFYIIRNYLNRRNV